MASRRLPQDTGDAKAVLVHVRRLAQHLGTVEAGCHDVLAQDILEREGVGGGRHALDVERLDVGGVLQDPGELGRVLVQLVVGQAQPGEARHVGDLFFGDGLGHPVIVTSAVPGPQGATVRPGTGLPPGWGVRTLYRLHMAKYPFLSDEWVTEARRIYAEVQAEGALPPGSTLVPVRLNLVVNEAPFSSEPLKAHIDTSEGHVAIDMGHLEKPDVTVSLDYPTARSLFVAGDVQTVMQAFLGGRIRVDGDMTKLLNPRSGIWPAGGTTAFGSRPGYANAAGSAAQQAGPQDAGSHEAGQQQLDVKMDKALAAATRLQEITQ
jgi:hypothetical protein